jgi:hypothetical protein
MSCGITCTALHIDHAYDWTEGHAYIASCVSDMIGFIRRTFDTRSFIDATKFARSLFDIEILAPRLLGFLKNLVKA